MQKQNLAEVLEEILRQDPRFDREAYQFLREGLDHTMKLFRRGAKGPQRHVTGQELLEGLRQYTLQQYGPLGKTVLNHWGIHRCEDFGAMVFNLVQRGVLGKSEQDSPEDFRGGYDFEEAFVKPFQPSPRSQPVRRGLADANPAERLNPPSRRQGSDKETLSSGPN